MARVHAPNIERLDRRLERGHFTLPRPAIGERVREALRAILFVLIVTALTGLALESARGATLHVSPDGSGEYPTIQSAVEAANDGDVVALDDGVYKGDGNRDVDYMGKAIEIRSASDDASVCIIDCEGSARTPRRGFVFRNDETREAVLRGVTVRNGVMLGKNGTLDTLGGAVLCTFGSPSISACIFEANEARIGGAFFASEGAPVFEDCVFTGNRATTGGGLNVELLAGGVLELSRCTFAGNISGAGGGVYVGNFAIVELERCIVAGNCATSTADDLFMDPASGVTLTCSILSTAVAGGGIPNIDPDTTIGDPLFCDPADCQDAPTTSGIYTLAENSPATAANSACGELIGALPVECGTIPVLPMSWSALKDRFGAR